MNGPRNSKVARAISRRAVLTVAEVAFWVAVIGTLLTLATSNAEARQPRFSVRTSSAVASPCHSCNVQKVVAAPVVHHAPQIVEKVVVQEVAAQPYYPPVQNFFYSVGQPLVQQSQMAAAVKDALAEYRFQATVDATINGSVQAAGQAIQQPAPQWQPPPEPTPPVQEPPTFSQTAPSHLEQHCAKCHANGAAKGGFSLESMTGDQLWAAIDRIKAGTMPPGGPLPPATAEAVAKELVARQP